jgi:two-component system chemotaxis sensor kinase CheA
MTVDMSKYLGLFVSEASDHLEALGRELVALEKDRSEAVIDSMFRHAHSVKGMAASMGLESTAILAHRIEDLFHAVRSNPDLLTGDVVDLLLAATDALVQHVRVVAVGRTPESPDDLLQQLAGKLTAFTGQKPTATRVARVKSASDDFTQARGAPSRPAEKPNALSNAPLGMTPRFSVKVRIEANAQSPGVRAFLLYKRLSNLGKVFELKPSIENLRSGRIPEGLVSFELETAASDADIQATLKSIPEIEVISVQSATPSVPEPSPPKAEVVEAPAPTQEGIRTVKIRTELLDYFLESVGELLLATAHLREWGKSLPQQSRQHLEEGMDGLQTRVKELHSKVMSARMTPLSMITDRFPRTCRDVARRRGREVDLIVTGAEIELDRAIIDNLSDPLLHLLRNCIDHGIESPEERARANKGPRGRILVGVRRSQDRVVIDIEDDGRGMDAQKLKAAAEAKGLFNAEALARMTDREAFMLACLPGISTAQDVTEISGRGVGLDAVKQVVEHVGGTLAIDSQRGRGTRFTLSLPLTVTVVNLLLAKVADEIVGFPLGKVVAAAEIDAEKLSASRDSMFLSHGNALIPVYELSQLLQWPTSPRNGVRPYIVAEGETGKVALAVDKLVGQEEVVLKVLPTPLNLISGLSGVSILGSGRPILILDVPRLVSA